MHYAVLSKIDCTISKLRALFPELTGKRCICRNIFTWWNRALAGDEWKRDFKTSEGRHGQSSPAITAPARSSASREGGAQHHRLDDESKDLLVMCLEDYPQLTLKHLALILQQSGCRRRGRRCRYTLDGWRRRILLDGISIAMQSVTGDQVAAQCRQSNTLLPECSTKSDIWLQISDKLSDKFFVTSHFLRSPVLTGFDVNELPSVLPNVVQYWRCACRVNTLQFDSDKAQNLLSKLHEHCLIRFALCRIWNVCRNAALRRNSTFIRRIRCALSPKLIALFSNTSSLILINCDTFEYGCTMPYCRKLTALFPNYVHCFQNWPEKGVDKSPMTTKFRQFHSSPKSSNKSTKPFFN